jgi:hypothetical protein
VVCHTTLPLPAGLITIAQVIFAQNAPVLKVNKSNNKIFVIAQRKFPTKPKIMLDRVLREKLIFQLFFCKASKHRQMQVSISHKARSAFQDTTPVHASLSSRIGDSRRQKSTF